MTNARRFAPTVVATVTPQSVETRQGVNGAYTVMQKAQIAREGRDTIVRTVMAFGQPNERISSMLSEGRAIELALRFNGGTMTVVGLPNEKAQPATTDADIVVGQPYAATVSATIDGILADAGIHADVAEAIRESMLGDQSERPVDDECDIDPDLIESHGHLLLPLIDAGIDIKEAMAVVRAIDATPSASYLADMAEMRRQNTARDFM